MIVPSRGDFPCCEDFASKTPNLVWHVAGLFLRRFIDQFRILHLTSTTNVSSWLEREDVTQIQYQFGFDGNFCRETSRSSDFLGRWENKQLMKLLPRVSFPFLGRSKAHFFFFALLFPLHAERIIFTPQIHHTKTGAKQVRKQDNNLLTNHRRFTNVPDRGKPVGN